LGGEKLNTRPACPLAAILTAAVIFIFFPQSVKAQDTSAATQGVAAIERNLPIQEESIILGETPLQQSGSGGASIWIVLRMVLILALAALAIYGVVFFIKRLSRPPQARDPYLKVLASVPLAGDTYAAVISVGARAWLVGGGSGAGVKLISEIDDRETLETMLIDNARKNADSGTGRILDFRSLLGRFTGTRDEASTIADSLRKQRERLKGLE